MDKTANSLEFLQSKDLIRELLRRYDHGVVCLMRIGEHGHGTISYERLWKGNSHTAAGLCADLSAEIMGALRAEHRTVPSELMGEDEPNPDGG